MTSPSIQTAIAQAQAAADAITPGQGQIVPFGRPISLMDNLVGSFAVDTWLKVKPYGMTIGKDTTTLFDKLPFRIDLSTVVYCRRVRYGNPAEYRTTYDGVSDVRGGLWADTVDRACSIDPKCQGDYRSADIPLIAAEDIVAKDGTDPCRSGKQDRLRPCHHRMARLGRSDPAPGGRRHRSRARPDRGHRPRSIQQERQW
jgi:hypothetical protein